MAVDISQIANNDGYLYQTDASNTILSTVRNTESGVRTFRSIGLEVSPIAARKSSSATLTVTSASGAGNITAITIGGVNQISGTITIATSTASVLAAQINAALAAFTPSGTVYTAQVNGAVVSFFAPEASGSTPNGTVITMTTSGASTYTLTPFGGGSSNTGLTDASLARKFFLNSDVAADPTTLTGAIDVTKYIVSRGLQVGMITNSLTIASDGLTGITRASALTTFNVDTEAAAASDILSYIDTTGFIEADILIIRGTNAARVVSVESAATTTSTNPNKNIYTTGNNPFTTSAYNALLLQYKYDTTLGGIWTEMFRSIASPNFDVELTRVAALALITAGTVQKGTRYLVYDVGDGIGLSSGNNAGIILTGATATSFENEGVFLAKIVNRTAVPAQYTPGLAPTINVRYEDYNEVYISNGVNALVHPCEDTTNWTFVAKSNATYYSNETQWCIYDIVNDIIRVRGDLRGNVVENSGTTASANELILQGFRWGTNLWIGNTVRYDQSAAGWSVGRLPNAYLIFSLSSITGTVAGNTIKDNTGCAYFGTTAGGNVAVFSRNILLANTNFYIDASEYIEVYDNTFTLGGITLEGGNWKQNNFIQSSISGNSGSTVTSNVGSYVINSNTDLVIGGVNASATDNATFTGVFVTISGNIGSQLGNCVFNGSCIFSANNKIVLTNSNLWSSELSNLDASAISNGVIDNIELVYSQITGLVWQTQFSLGTLYLNNSFISDCLLTNTSGITSLEGINLVGHFIDGEGTKNPLVWYFEDGLLSDNGYGFSMIGEESGATFPINIAAASSFSLNTLTIPAGLDHVGTFIIQNASGEVIDKIPNLYPANTNPALNLKKTFRVESGSVTFSPNAVATPPSANQFASGEGAVALTRIQDSITFKKVDGLLYVVDQVKLI